MIDENKLKAYLAEIEEVNKKHKMRLEPVLSSNNYAIQAQFNVREVEEPKDGEKPKADKPADKGDKGAKK